MDTRERSRLELHEHGFDGDLVIEVRGGARWVHVAGTRPQDGSTVAKDIPADRDPQLEALVERVLAGEEGASVTLLAHVGVLDPD